MVSVSVCLQTEFLAYPVYGVKKLPTEELEFFFQTLRLNGSRPKCP